MKNNPLYIILESKIFIEKILQLLGTPKILWIALSGGRDSVCLLYIAIKVINRLREILSLSMILPKIYAIHINHHFHKDAAKFENFCHTLCAKFNVPLFVEHLHLHKFNENIAREARYYFFYKHLNKNDVIWLAHHRDDQSETFIMRLMRRAGVKGLTGIPHIRSLGKGKLMRPLLGVTGEVINAYALKYNLNWIDDISNLYINFDRNYVRHNIIPYIKIRWPDAIESLALCVDYLKESDNLLNCFAKDMLQAISNNHSIIPIDKIIIIENARLKLLIRYCLLCLKFPMPPKKRLDTLINQIKKTNGSMFCIRWENVEARCWRRIFFILYTKKKSLSIFYINLIKLQSSFLKKMDLSLLTIIHIKCSEFFFINGHKRNIKKILQFANIPIWERNSIMLLFIINELIAIIGINFIFVSDNCNLKKLII
ncbi:tRNA(Ile)-lysidine synthetase [Candidatus Johnevansia muelleri]|uniref:tRNA(Ile)-lysidine synthase n=1 Tax=Candidatus Johnevansia muelleri TaxID=1495769 RepID=A0A078KHA2_9GAMM|nr:tRNA(Ile)-lysidine synthetase [Candidatus Evansia muelleri]